MSLIRFAGYFIALTVCATAAFASLPAPPAGPPAMDDAARPVQVALAR